MRPTGGLESVLAEESEGSTVATDGRAAEPTAWERGERQSAGLIGMRISGM